VSNPSSSIGGVEGNRRKMMTWREREREREKINKGRK